MKYEIKFVFSFSVFFTVKDIFFTAVKHILHIFTCVLPDYFLLNSANEQNLRSNLSNFNIKKCI